MRTLTIPLAAMLVVSLSVAPRRQPAPTVVKARTMIDTTVVRVRGSTIDSAFRSLAASRAASDNFRDLPTGDLTRYQLIVLSRREMGPPEFHSHWTDVVLVRSGGAVLRAGPVLSDRVEKGEGEASGSGIPKARERTVGVGDVVVIPAGLAHQWRPTGTDPFAYMVLKLHPAAVGKSGAVAGVP